MRVSKREVEKIMRETRARGGKHNKLGVNLFPFPVAQRIGGNFRGRVVRSVLCIWRLLLPEVAMHKAAYNCLAAHTLGLRTAIQKLALEENSLVWVRNRIDAQFENFMQSTLLPSFLRKAWIVFSILRSLCSKRSFLSARARRSFDLAVAARPTTLRARCTELTLAKVRTNLSQLLIEFVYIIKRKRIEYIYGRQWTSSTL